MFNVGRAFSSQLGAPNFFAEIGKRMARESYVLKVASQNMANVHTPGYKAYEVVPMRTQKSGTQKSFGMLMPEMTHPRHLAKQGSGDFQIQHKAGGLASLSGNNVSEMIELQTVNNANTKHREMVHLVQSFAHMLEMPLRK